MIQLLEEYERNRCNEYDNNNNRNHRYFNELKRLQVDLQEDSFELYNYLNNKMGNLKLLTKILYGNSTSIDKDDNTNTTASGTNKGKGKDNKSKNTTTSKVTTTTTTLTPTTAFTTVTTVTL